MQVSKSETPVSYRKHISFCICLFEVWIVSDSRKCIRAKTQYPLIKSLDNTCKQ